MRDDGNARTQSIHERIEALPNDRYSLGAFDGLWWPDAGRATSRIDERAHFRRPLNRRLDGCFGERLSAHRWGPTLRPAPEALASATVESQHLPRPEPPTAPP